MFDESRIVTRHFSAVLSLEGRAEIIEFDE
jgi:hypothetical protein